MNAQRKRWAETLREGFRRPNSQRCGLLGGEARGGATPRDRSSRNMTVANSSSRSEAHRNNPCGTSRSPQSTRECPNDELWSHLSDRPAENGGEEA